MSGIFISYRRDDTSGQAGRLYDRLAGHFGKDQVFMDIDTLRPGVDFVKVINESVGSCEVLIAVIGKQWLTGTDEKGRRRLDDPDDFIRLEISAALDRDVRVIPALVGGAPMPKTDLPEALQGLTRRHAIEISDGRFHQDVDRLIEAIEEVVGRQEPPPVPKPSGFWDFIKRRASILGLGLALLVAAFAASLYFQPAKTVVQPQATISADPLRIHEGQSTTLTWEVTDASTVSIEPGVGSVGPSGARQVSPSSTTTYTISAMGSGGQSDASVEVRVTVVAAKKPPVPTVTMSASPSEIQRGRLRFLSGLPLMQPTSLSSLVSGRSVPRPLARFLRRFLRLTQSMREVMEERQVTR